MPHRKFSLEVFRDLTLRTDFESGSIQYLSHEIGPTTNTPHLYLSLVPDNACVDKDGGADDDSGPTAGDGGSTLSFPNRMWYYYRVEFGPSTLGKFESLKFSIQNVASKGKLYPQGYKPVVRDSRAESTWEAVPQAVELEVSDNIANPYGATITFSVPVCGVGVSWLEVAFAVPYTLSDLETAMGGWEAKAFARGLYFQRTILTTSHFGYPLYEFRISNPTSKGEGGALLFSARVHPSEVPASWMLHGIVDELIANPQLLNDFTSVSFVPMLNPDGVQMGYTRGDREGRNLNRYYDTPNARDHPTVLAMRNHFLALHRTEGICTYIDLHAHATRRGCFLYGNKLSSSLDEERAVALLLDSLSSKCEQFDRTGCNFSEKNMASKGKNDVRTKAGSSRVALYNLTGHTRCFTFEVNYHSSHPKTKAAGDYYTVGTFLSIGKAILQSCHCVHLGFVSFMQNQNTSMVPASKEKSQPTATIKRTNSQRRSSLSKAFLNACVVTDTTTSTTRKKGEVIVV